MNYTVVAIKKESHEYSRGCLIESYSAHTAIHSPLTRQEAIHKFVDYWVRREYLEWAETGYELFFFCNGYPFLIPDVRCVKHGLGGLCENPYKEEYDIFVKELDAAKPKAEQARLDLKKALAEKKEAHKKLLEEEEMIIEEEREQEEYNRLRAKFEKPS